MRISDWSSDVCSADLGKTTTLNVTVGTRPPEEELNGSNFDPEAEQTMPDEPSEGADQAIQEQLGMAVQPLTADIARDIGVDQGTKGLVIAAVRSEEHTSELQSLMRISYALLCLKKKTKKKTLQVYI